MPSRSTTVSPTEPTIPPDDPHAPDGGNHPHDPKAKDSNTTPADAKGDSYAKGESKSASQAPGLFVVLYDGAAGQTVELLGEDQAAARVSMLTWGSKQHRKEAEEAGDEIPEGGGSHELNRRDVHVYRLNASEVTDF